MQIGSEIKVIIQDEDGVESVVSGIVSNVDYEADGAVVVMICGEAVTVMVEDIVE